MSVAPLSSYELQLIEENPYRADFPLLANANELVYLDSAATAQRPKRVIDALGDFYSTINANPLRGLYALSVEATQAVDAAREKIARFIGAKNANEIIFTRNTSESLNLVASSLSAHMLSEGDEIVVSIAEHHSNIVPWQQSAKRHNAKLNYLYLDENFEISEHELQKIGPRTKIVAVTQVSNVLGTAFDIQTIAERAHEQGALLVVDAAQSVPHMRVDVDTLGCDFLAFSAHKMGGPMGIGVLWGKYELLQAMPPFLTGGEMIDSVSEQEAVWAPVPAKFEAGTQDAAGAYATGVAVDYLLEKDFSLLEKRERLLGHYLAERLSELPYIEILGPSEAQRHIGAFSFNVGDIHPHDVASLLDMQGICIRAGRHCAEPLLTSLGQHSSCRASVAFYNDKHDIDRLIDGLKQVWRTFHG